jgi:threonine/homoserine/homoserine lactone efflux protein
MISIQELLFFALAAFAMVLTPGPNMIYLISRSITQGKTAGLISLVGVVCGFLFHIVMVAFGLTAVLFAVPFTFTALKILGAIYLLYLAYNAVKPGRKNIFETRPDLTKDKPAKLFMMGFLTNVLNPKMAVFYLSLFPQFIKPEGGSVTAQCFQLGLTQMMISFMVNFLIILSAAKAAKWFSQNPKWVKVQQWFMAGILTSLAIKMIFTKAK